MAIHKKIIYHKDLKAGQVKVVVYLKGDIVLIVPDPAWDMRGDLTRVPVRKRKYLQSPRKNGIKKRQVVISQSTRTMLVPSGSKVLDDFATKGYFESDRAVRINESVGCTR